MGREGANWHGAADPADVVFVACVAAGAVVGFSLTGGAAAGSFLGAAIGFALSSALRRQRGSSGPA